MKAIVRWLAARWKDIILGMLLALFLALSVTSMMRGMEFATIGFIAAAAAMLVFIFPEKIESVRFGSFEMKLRQAEKAVTEARALAKLVAEIAIPLAHHSTGWAEAAPSTVQTRDAVLGRVLRMKDRFGIEISGDIWELHYVKTCADYEHCIVESLSKAQKSAFLNELGTTYIPTRIEDVPSPQRMEDILKRLEFWNDCIETLIEDYRHYYKNRTHRSEERWKQRAGWKRPSTNAE